MHSRGKNACSKCCVSFVQWIPVIFIFAIIGWSYYAYVYSLSIVMVSSALQRVLYLIFYHALLLIFAWSYAKCILEPPLSPPPEFKLTTQDWDLLRGVQNTDQDRNTIIERLVENRQLPVYMVGRDGNINVCSICGIIKPDRAHHCSTCNKCVLQLDHHCPWTNNCVGFHNHKYFIVFLGWGAVYCFYITATSTPFFIEFWSFGDLTVDRFQVLFLFIVSLMFGICQLVLGGYHCYLVGRNQTTLETFGAPKFRDGTSDPRAFDLGTKTNLQQVFGRNCFLAIFPVMTTLGDGIHWTYRTGTDDSRMLDHGRTSLIALNSTP
ncbi:hypothetical protein CRM22_001302 [Opisthorchis felineus]|uniref:Palmitoyltransferase n=1 Tax=Opisthorchis felineus TaxID=147828 RepID=A0A4S2MB91_OPIFE|nr:hypothetical protein CRM22_001302 [Opisthorchis felineus]